MNLDILKMYQKIPKTVKGICTGGDETCQEGDPPLTSQTRSWITSDLLDRFGCGVAQNQARGRGVRFRR